MRVTFTIYYNVDNNIFIMYDDEIPSRTEINVNDYSYYSNSYLVYFIVYINCGGFNNTYVGSHMHLTRLLIVSDFRDFVKKNTNSLILFKGYAKNMVINVLLHLLYILGYQKE